MSLTYDAARREVLRHRGRSRRGGRRRRVRRARGGGSPPTTATRRCTGSATSATPAGPTCRPGHRRTRVPTRCGCGCATRWSSSTRHPPYLRHRRRKLRETAQDHDRCRSVPGWYDDAFAEVQEQLRAGNTYEVNLTYREQVASGGGPGRGVPPAARDQPRAVRRLPAAPRRPPAQLEPGAVRDRRPAPVAGDPADQGHHARAARRPRRTRRTGPRWPRTRATAPRT